MLSPLVWCRENDTARKLGKSCQIPCRSFVTTVSSTTHLVIPVPRWGSAIALAYFGQRKIANVQCYGSRIYCYAYNNSCIGLKQNLNKGGGFQVWLDSIKDMCRYSRKSPLCLVSTECITCGLTVFWDSKNWKLASDSVAFPSLARWSYQEDASIPSKAFTMTVRNERALSGKSNKV